MVKNCPTCGNILVEKNFGPLIIDSLFHSVKWKEMTMRVTPGELTVLKALLDGDGKPVSARTIHEKCFSKYSLLQNVVVTLGNLKKKFHSIDPDFDRIHSVRGIGYIWRTE